MKIFFQYICIISLVIYCKPTNSSEISEAFSTIELRKTAMQGLWDRIQRISPYVELKEKVDYNKDIAADDAKAILSLIKKTRSLWSENSNLSAKGFTNATPAVWALPNYFEKLYTSAEKSAFNLKDAIINDDVDGAVVAMCNLGKSCGTCHANFRRLLTSQLSNEVSGWSGKYINNCK